MTRRECRAGLRQPVFWLVLALLAIIAWTDSGDPVHLYNSEIASTGIWPFNTSAVSQALRQGGILMVIAPWALAMTLGLVVIRDLELRIVEVFNSTRLTPREYVWGKFAGVTGFFLLVWGLYLVLAMGFDHIVQGSGGHYLIGPFALRNYFVPTLLIGLPQILFYAGMSLFIGTWTRRPVVVFLFPVVMLLYRFTPWWGLMPQGISEAVALFDPIGVFWVDDTYVAGRTTEQVNTAALIPDAVFLLSRLAWAGLGLAGVAGAVVIYARQVRTGVSGRGLRAAHGLIGFLRGPRRIAAEIRPQAEPTLADLRMTTRPLGFRRAAGAIARSEIRDLLVRPGMYLCVPLILWIATARASVIDSLLTSGISASRQYTELGMFLCLLLLFYTVESLHRERGRRMHEIYGSAPVPTGAILFGKALGNSVMAAFILVVVLLASAGVIVHRQIAQGSPVGFELWPFVAVWGGVLLPTFIFWTALITALFALFRNRYVVYGAGMAVFILTLRTSIDERFKSWSTNWMGLDVLTWSDMGAFAPHGQPLLLNRLLYLSLVPLLIALSVRWYRRRDLDATGLAGRLSPRPLLRDAVRVLPLAVPPIVLASMLVVGGRSGYQGPAAEEWEKDYWSRNVATWEGFRMPSVSHVDLDLDIEPAERSVAVDGAYTFRNHRDQAYDRFLLTAGPWEPIEWTLGGEPYEPENRDGLYVFTPAAPLEPGDTVTIGFRYRVTVLGGISRTPQPVGKFVLESGVNIDGFEPVFAPVPGYRPGHRFGVPGSAGVQGRLPRRPNGTRHPVGRTGLHRADTDHDAGGVHRARSRGSGERREVRRQAHGGVGDGPPRGDVQRGRREVRRARGRGHRGLPSPGARLQYRGDGAGPRRRAEVLRRVVPPLPVECAQAVGVPGLPGRRTGVSDEHRDQRIRGLPGQERARFAGAVRDRRARSRPQLVGCAAHAGRGARRRRPPVGRDGRVRRHAPGRAGLRGPRADGVQQAARARPRHRVPPGVFHAAGPNHVGRLQPWPLDHVDAAAGDGPGAPPVRTARVHRGVQGGPGLSGDSGHAGGVA